MNALPIGLICHLGYAVAMLLVSDLQAPTDAEVLHWALHAYDYEPGVRETQSAALLQAHVDTDRAQRMRDRARWAHSLPGDWELRITGDEGDDNKFATRENLGEDLSVLNTQTTTASNQDEALRWTMVVRWETHRLIFDPDELEAARGAEREVERRAVVLQRVTSVYFARRKLQVVSLLDPPFLPSEAAHTKLRVLELTAELDALTGGWFSGELSKRAPRRRSREPR